MLRCELVLVQFGLCKIIVQEFEQSGDSENHLKELLELAKEGVVRGKVFQTAC